MSAIASTIDRQTSGRTKALTGRDILCFSHDWTGDPLSKTHLIRVLSKDNRILWVNAIANRTPTASPKDIRRVIGKLKSFTRPIAEVEPNIFVLNPLAIPSYGNRLVRGFNEKFLLSQVKRAMKKLQITSPINMVFNPAAGLLAGKLGEEELIYYCVDDYTAFTGVAPGLREIEEDLFKSADLVIVSAKKLFEDKKDLNENTFVIRHGVDWKHFRAALAEETLVPAELKKLPRPIIGFHGLLADWVDYRLIRKLAEHFRDASLVLVGKVAVDAEQKIQVLGDVENVHLLGQKAYGELPNYCKGFDLAINPFVINDLTLAANPLKIREYLAAGLKVVSTDLPEVRILDYCEVANTAEGFIRLVGDAIDKPAERLRISDSVKDESWEARVEQLRTIVEEVTLKG